ncbi:hypothetical protein ABG067_002603 [Albugo candida]
MAYGYGASDHLISRFSDVIGKFETSNQYFSVLDQLQLGVRLIEVDIHYFNNQIRVAHCGGFTSSTLDSLLNRVRKLPFVGKFVHSSGIIGCQPSFSGIPTKDQQPVENLLREIANWLQKSTTQFVFVYLDGDMQLLEEKKVNLLIKLIKDIFVDSEIFRPSDRAVRCDSDLLLAVHPNLAFEQNTETWPSTLELLQYGKRVMFLSRYDYSAQDDSYLFFKENVCNWTEPSLPLTDYPNCYFNKSQVFASSLYGTIDRVLSSEIQYGLFNSDGQFRQEENILDERNLLGVLKCGVNIPSPDNITPVRMQSMIWTMARENTWSPGSCLGLERNSEFWHQIDCQAIPANTAAACQSIKDARIWTISARAVLSLDDALEACAQTEAVATENLVVMAFSIPATAYENVVLMEAFKSSRFDRVIFNTNLLNM